MSEYVANMVCILVRSMAPIYSILFNYVRATFTFCTSFQNVTFLFGLQSDFGTIPYVNRKRAPYLFENDVVKC